MLIELLCPIDRAMEVRNAKLKNAIANGKGPPQGIPDVTKSLDVKGTTRSKTEYTVRKSNNTRAGYQCQIFVTIT